jgi:hypothetical protein
MKESKVPVKIQTLSGGGLVIRSQRPKTLSHIPPYKYFCNFLIMQIIIPPPPLKPQKDKATFSVGEHEEVQLLEHHLQSYAVDRQEPHDFC